MSRLTRAAAAVAAAVFALVVPAACGGDGGTGPAQVEQVDGYLSALPSWSAFAPPQAEVDSAVAGAPAFSQDTVARDSAATSTLGQYTVRNNVIYACEETPYSATKTPSELVMYSPNPAFLWPGAFIQGKSHRDAGTVLPLVIDERAPIKVSIPGLSTGQNFRTVETVDQASVAAAVGDMIGGAVADNLNTGSTTFFKVDAFHSEQEFALKLGMSGRYLGWKARTQANTSTRGSQTIVSVQFRQRMFEVVVAPPSSPGGWFTPAFTEARLQQQVSQHRIGPDNLPVYVGKVIYGRMMMFTMKSSASESEMKGILQASYTALGNGAAASLDARQKNILQQSEIEIFSMGGADSATASMIRSGDWRSYFTVSAPLSTAVPLSYEFRSVADNTLASVSETTNYTRRTCQELSQVAGQLQFLGQQAFAAPVPSPYDVRLADVNGDGRADLIWNHRTAASNDVAVSLASAAGTFGSPGSWSYGQPAPAEGWINFDLDVGDVSGDGRADLVWSYRGASGFKVFTARAQAGSGFTFDPQQTLSSASFAGYTMQLGDVTGDGAADLIVNALGTANLVRTAASNKDGTYTLSPQFSHPNSGWSSYRLLLGDLNRDGRTDLVWSNVPLGNQPNRTHGALSLASGALQAIGLKDHSTVCCWNTYTPFVADFDADQIADIYWVRNNDPDVYLHRFKGNGSGGWTQLGGRDLGKSIGRYAASVGDFNGDGRADFAFTKTTTDSARLRIGISDPSGLTNLSPVEQKVPAIASFNLARTFVARVNGDTRDDVVWVIPAATTEVYVAVALP